MAVKALPVLGRERFFYAALHARGMMVKHRLEAVAVVPTWWVWLYWLCWAGLLVVGALVLVDWLG